LDLGCGNGELARDLARRRFRGAYLGLDFSDALSMAACIISRSGENQNPL
ncbi:TPA: class I SAM-dependent methyltransferase, partial [Candidatus Bipolaricaulota bacterium]|nr:class I SAM-dependent methyltransferase [Candidatus Bipolaricaulota bacterium]